MNSIVKGFRFFVLGVAVTTLTIAVYTQPPISGWYKASLLAWIASNALAFYARS